MELDTLKSFIRMHVEVLVGGMWIDGLMLPIVKSVVTLLPTKEASPFYGPTACKAEDIRAIRQVKAKVVDLPAEENKLPADVRSGLDQVTPAQRFGKK